MEGLLFLGCLGSGGFLWLKDGNNKRVLRIGGWLKATSIQFMVAFRSDTCV
jgi:hypothetical protein